MPLTNPNKVVTEERLSEFYGQILPYMGGMPDVLANKFSKGDLYSTDEKMIGQWIDGKPLYQKTVTGNVVLTTWLDMGVTDEITVVGINGTASNTTDNGTLPISYANTGSYTLSVVANTDENKGKFIFFGSSNYANNYMFRLTFQYTKTTDSPIAIGSDTDYSTDEKIVGTWIDGSPVWQKTGVSNNHTGDVSVALPTGVNGSTIVSLNAYKIDGSDFLPFGVIWDTSNSINVYATGSTLHLIDTKSGRSGTFYYTIQYTKTS